MGTMVSSNGLAVAVQLPAQLRGPCLCADHAVGGIGAGPQRLRSLPHPVASSDCQRCADYADGYTDSALDAREWELGEHEPDCDCTPCETVREVIRSFVGMLRSSHGPQDTGRK